MLQTEKKIVLFSLFHNAKTECFRRLFKKIKNVHVAILFIKLIISYM
jgi:hypothetical protein